MFHEETLGYKPAVHSGQSDHHPSAPEHPEHPEHPNHPNRPEQPDEPIVIIVNGVDKTLPLGTTHLSYDDVVRLAGESDTNEAQTIYSVVYANGPAENIRGTLVKGKCVAVRKGMIFNVGRSDKS